MASILKNQILKHLSKFTKNLSPDKINLSTLRGEGELSNLELDEDILMDLMDLPTWMKLNKAVCNRVSIKIVWTKLKTLPICIYLDEVVLEVETCDEPRPPNHPAHQASYRSGGKYGFADRVIDGIYVHINAVSVRFISKKFHATLQLSRVVVQSVSPNWQKVDDLRNTKIRDSNRGEILLFKEVEWQTTRIEATAVEGETSEQLLLTPLRFIANQSKIRITIKKRLSDCSIIATRLMLYLDDILWVLTDTQLKAAIMYANSLKEMIQKSREQSKKLAAEKLQRQGHLSQAYLQQQQQAQQRARTQSTSNIAQYFSRYDVQTTSYHLITSRIDLHLCDDNCPESRNMTNPKHNKLIEGGAMQITFYRLSVDVYPFNPADETLIMSRGGERKHWHRYTDNQGSRNYWVQQLFAAFKKDVTKARETCCVASPSQSPAHEPANHRTPDKSHVTNQSNPNRSPPTSHQPPPIKVTGTNQAPRQRTTKLLESCTVLKLEEFTIYQVSTADNKRNTPKKFLSSDKKQLHLPSDMSVLHVEFTDYFFPEGIDYPVPNANMYILINPIRLTLDYLTVLWTNFFLLNLSQSVNPQLLDDAPKQHVDIKLEALMPRVILQSEHKAEGGQPERPDGVQVQVSKLCATNTRVEERTSREDLAEILSHYAKGDIFTSHQYPNNNNKLVSVPKHFFTYSKSQDNPYLMSYAKGLIAGHLPEDMESQSGLGPDNISKLLRTNTLKQNASFDVWSVCADQVWLEFVGVPSSKSRPVPFVESVPVTLWFCRPQVIDEAERKRKSSEHNNLSINRVNSQQQQQKNGENVQKGSNRETMSPERESRSARKLLRSYYSSDSDITPDDASDKPVCDNSSTSDSQSSATSLDGSGDDKVQYLSCEIADYNIVAKVGGMVRAQMNHFQYLFIIRLLESLSNFQLELAADVEYFLGISSTPSTFSIPLIIPELEFVMVCPYIAELLPFSHQAPLSPSATSVRDEDLMEEPEGRDTLVEDIEEVEIEQIVEDAASEHSDSLLTSDSLSSHTAISKSQSDSRIQCHNSHNLPGEETLGNKDSGMITSTRISQSAQILSNSNDDLTDSGFGSRTSGSTQVKKTATKAADQVKKSFSSALSNISGFTDKIKAKMDSSDDTLEDFDTMSIKTDASDEDLDFEILALEDGEIPAFHHHPPPETASSTDTDQLDDLSSLYAESSTATKGRELVSLIAFKVYGAELLLQNDGKDTSVRLQAQQLTTQQPGNMYYEDFYTKFISPSAITGQTDKPNVDEPKSFTVKMKMVSGPGADMDGSRSGYKGKMDPAAYLSVKAEKCGLSFNNSSLANLAKFVEDDAVGEPIPMHVTVSDFFLRLQDDCPKLPPIKETPPVQLHIHKLAISRGYDNIFHLTGEPVPFKILASAISSSEISGLEMSRKKDKSQIMGKKDTSQTMDNSSEILEKENKELLKLLQNHREEMLKLSQQLKASDSENQRLQSQLNKLGHMTNNRIDPKTNNDCFNNENGIEVENLKLQQKVVSLEDDITSLTKEKDSLLATLKLLQDELLISEERHRNKHHMPDHRS